MSQRRLRDELRDVFDAMSEPAHPALSARIREGLTSRPAPGPRVPRLAAAVAVLAAILVVASLLFVSQRAASRPTVPAGTPAPTATTPPAATATPVPVVPGPTTSAAPAPSPSASASSTPAEAALPPFSCAAQSGQGPASGATGVTQVRASGQSGYDRFVIQFTGPVPQYDVGPVPSSTFVQDPSGRPVTLSGSAGLAVTLHGVTSGSYTGPTDLKPSDTAVLKEARQTGDFEGVMHWGLGLSHAACFRAFTLTGPNRLVIDIQS